METEFHKTAVKHYENFPVGSWLIPKRYRKPIQLIYAFARTADDFADEGANTPTERIRNINHWQSELHTALNHNSGSPFFLDLASAINEHHLSIQYFDDLLVAFRMDAENPTYTSFDEVLEYCRYSANPVGRLMLQLFKASDETNNQFSDHICTALQLTNFWQDISVDTRRNRLYIPQSDFDRYDVRREDLRSGENTANVRALLKMQTERTRELFFHGKPLFERVGKDFRRELRAVWHGGMRILEKIEKMEFDTRFTRPSLSATDMMVIMMRSFLD